MVKKVAIVTAMLILVEYHRLRVVVHSESGSQRSSECMKLWDMQSHHYPGSSDRFWCSWGHGRSTSHYTSYSREYLSVFLLLYPGEG